MKKGLKKLCACVLAASLVVAGLALTPAEFQAAKKPALNKKKVSVDVGSTYKLKIKNAVKAAKTTWKTSKKSVVSISKKSEKGKNAYALIKGESAGSAKIIATYKAGKTKKKLTCAVTVTSTGTETNIPAGTTTTVPAATTNQPAGTVTTAPPTLTTPPNTNVTEAPAEPEATASPTVRPTRTPRATATPTAVPTSTPKLEDVSGALNLSGVTSNPDGAATYSSGKIVINDTNSGEGATNVFIPLPSKVLYEENVTIVLKGSSSKADNAFRVWIGNGGSNGAAEIKTIQNLSVGEFSETFTLTAKTQAVAESGGIGTADIDTLTIKSTGVDGPRITGITIDSIEIYYIDRGATVGGATAAPKPTNTPGPTTAPNDASGSLDLSKMTQESDGMATYSSGKIQINDNNSGDGATVVYIPLPAKVQYEETVTIVVKGSSSKDNNAIRIWIGNGGASGVVEQKRIENIATGEFSETFTLTAKTQAAAEGVNIGTADIDRLTIKSTSNTGPRITGITIDSIKIYYTKSKRCR